MPRCVCAFHLADRDGRLDDYLEWLASGEPCAHEMRHVRTLAHPIRGAWECQRCYVTAEFDAEGVGLSA